MAFGVSRMIYPFGIKPIVNELFSFMSKGGIVIGAIIGKSSSWWKKADTRNKLWTQNTLQRIFHTYTKYTFSDLPIQLDRCCHTHTYTSNKMVAFPPSLTQLKKQFVWLNVAYWYALWYYILLRLLYSLRVYSYMCECVHLPYSKWLLRWLGFFSFEWWAFN